MKTSDFPLLFTGDKYKDGWACYDTSKYFKSVENPLLDVITDPFFKDNPGFFEASILTDPDYLHYFIYLLTGYTVYPFQATIFEELWKRPFPMLVASRGASKSWILAMYSLIKSFIVPEYKIILAGASFRQSKNIFKYIETIWDKSHLLRNMCSSKSGPKYSSDGWEFYINDSLITCIPIGHDGGKVRGYRANCTIVDEFKDHNPIIVEEVLFGFGATSGDVATSVKYEMMREAMKKDGIQMDAMETRKDVYASQGIIAGTADYYFNHFYEYFNRYKAIIKYGNDVEKLKELGIATFENQEFLKPEDFSLMRLPYNVLPAGFMDMKMIARQKTQMSKQLFMKEYGAVFVEDSGGFYPRSAIMKATADEKNVQSEDWPDYCPSVFDVKMAGDPNLEYVMGIDPAKKRDNFAIVITELHNEHYRVVHSWTSNEKDFIEQKNKGYVETPDYYEFCILKIRELMRKFNIVRIGIDAQGGGEPIISGLANKKHCREDEHQIWEIREKGKKKPDDKQKGLHILIPIQFANAIWMSSSNHNLLSAISQRRVLFPRFDVVSGELAAAHDKMVEEVFKKMNPGKRLKLFDRMDDAIAEVEELKDELSCIQYSRTGSGIGSREKWSFPETTEPGNNRVSLKKDRYSAFLIASSISETLISIGNRQVASSNYYAGGLVSQISGNSEGELYKFNNGSTDSPNFNFIGLINKG